MEPKGLFWVQDRRTNMDPPSDYTGSSEKPTRGGEDSCILSGTPSSIIPDGNLLQNPQKRNSLHLMWLPPHAGSESRALVLQSGLSADRKPKSKHKRELPAFHRLKRCL